MAKYNSLSALFTATANAIRAKTGGTDPIVAEDFPTAVDSIKSSGFPNGKEWTTSNVTEGQFSSICYEEGLWVVGGPSGILRSTDGKTWTYCNSELSVRHICKFDGLWMAACSTGLWYSSDGISWVQSDCTINAYACYKANGLWAAGGWSSGIWYSTNGIEWTPSNNGSNDVCNLCYANGTWVAACANIGMLFSIDGKEWAGTSITVGSYYNSIVYINGAFIAAGVSGVCRSSDGQTWTVLDSTFGDKGVYYANGILYLYSTASSSSNRMLVKYSTDGGATWASTDIRTYSVSISYGNGIWLMSDAGRMVRYSTDGITWKSLEDYTQRYFKCLYANGIWVQVFPYTSKGISYSVAWEDS